MNRFLPILFLVLVFTNCKKEFNPPAIQAANSFLVVDGYINLTPNDSTIITLSRTKKLTDTTFAIIPELLAQVYIESQSGSSYTLTDNNFTGHFTSAALNLPLSEKYRLKVVTTDQHTYLSEFVTPQSSPPIDSLTWQQDQDVSIYLDAHDPNNNTFYYKWDFIETWEHHARIENYWGVENGHIFPSDASTQKYKCWSTANSTSILTGTSIALSQDIISHAPITTIIKDDVRIKVRYSILVRQIPLSLEAYNYWVIIQKNSQQLGTLFDLQPSQLTGNIHSETDPDEPVIGFVSAVSPAEKRIFITNLELIDWSNVVTGGPECTTATINTNFPDIYSYTYPNPDYAPFYFANQSALIVIRKECIDCRLRGGTTFKPSFW
jgi:Domain of unknown function (DUF4249)